MTYLLSSICALSYYLNLKEEIARETSEGDGGRGQSGLNSDLDLLAV